MTGLKSAARAASLLVLAAILSLAPACGKESKQPEPKKPTAVTVLFFNDLHGHLLPFTVDRDGKKVEVGGIARLAYLIKTIRAENDARGAKTIVLVAGDILQGTPMSTVFKGKPDVECLNAMGVDAMTIGNHEFDFGLDNFLTLQKLARFPFLSSNVMDKNSGRLLVSPSQSIPLGAGLQLTVIGATTPELMVTTKPENVTSLEVQDPVETVKAEAEKHRAGGPLILLSHCRNRTDRRIIDANPNLTAVIAGHDQILFSPARKEGAVPIFEAFEKGKYLGRLELEINPSGRARIISNDYLPITAAIPEDQQIKDLVDSYHRQLDQRFTEVIGQAAVFLNGERGQIRFEETNLGDFVTDVMREYTGADVALLNAGSLRSSIQEGPITVETVFKVMPYENELVTVKLTGQELLEALTRAVQGTREDEDGGFLHVSGLTFLIKGKQVKDVMVGGKPLDPAAEYSSAITDFLSSGGDGYQVFTGKDPVRTGLPLRELLVDTIRERQTIGAPVQQRIVREQ